MGFVRVLLLFAFLGCGIAAFYFRLQAVRHRDPEVSSWDPRIAFGFGLTEEGSRYWTLFNRALLCMALFGVLAILVWPR